MRIQNIAALTDFSTQAEQALDRAALLAREHQASLCLVYATEELDPRFENPQARLEQRARQLARRHEIHAYTREYDDVSGVAERALAAASGADLLVIDKRLERDWSRPWRGSTLSRCLRQSPCPVLVVQQQADEEQGGAEYARMLVAVDGSLQSRDLVQYAGRLQRDAALDLFNANEGSAQSEVQEELLAIQQYRDELQREDGSGRAMRIKDIDNARRNRVDSHMGTRDVARQLVVQQQRSRADLIVVGARRNHWLDRWALSARAMRLVTDGSCDVLVCGQMPQETVDSPPERQFANRQKGWPQLKY